MTFPLFKAALAGDVRKCEMLLAAGADVNRTTGEQCGVVTALAVAAFCGHDNVCRVLLDAGALHTPAVHTRQFTTRVDVLRDYVFRSASPLLLASFAKHEKTCAVLLEKGALQTPTLDGITPLHAAAMCRTVDDSDRMEDIRRDVRLCKLLLDHGATHAPNHEGETPLMLAAGRLSAEMCSLLLERGATFTTANDGSNPLVTALRSEWLWIGDGDDRAMIEDATRTCTVLCRHHPEGAMNNLVRGKTLLMMAATASSGDVSELCKLFIRHGAEITAVGAGWDASVTALHKACQNNAHPNVVKTLLAAGAVVDERNVDSWTPLHEAIYHGNVEVCKVLLDHGADASLANDSGNNAMLLAVKIDNAPICALLMSRGVCALCTNTVTNETLFDTARTHSRLNAYMQLLHSQAVRDSVPRKVIIATIRYAFRQGMFDAIDKLMAAHPELLARLPRNILTRQQWTIQTVALTLRILAHGNTPDADTLVALLSERGAATRQDVSSVGVRVCGEETGRVVELMALLTGWSVCQLRKLFCTWRCFRPEGFCTYVHRGRALRTWWLSAHRRHTQHIVGMVSDLKYMSAPHVSHVGTPSKTRWPWWTVDRILFEWHFSPFKASMATALGACRV